MPYQRPTARVLSEDEILSRARSILEAVRAADGIEAARFAIQDGYGGGLSFIDAVYLGEVAYLAFRGDFYLLPADDDQDGADDAQ